MNALTPSHPSSYTNHSRINGASKRGLMSSGELSADPFSFRKAYAARWSRAIRANFSSVMQVKEAFRIDLSTAENWWNGTNSPSGWAVDYAYENRLIEPPEGDR